MSKTQTALRLLDENPEMTVYAAAKAAGLVPTALYQAIKIRDRQRAAGKAACPCCNSLVPAEQINRSVLK